MKKVRAKKHLGQHFLIDKNIAEKIVDSLEEKRGNLIEIGPGMGVLTDFILQRGYNLKIIDLDRDSISYLHKKYPQLKSDIIEGDFLQLNVGELFEGKPFSVIGNFPYNISSQILFTVYDNRDKVNEVVGMFQKEVAERIASPPGSKVYGILSVLLQAFFDIEYLFTVHEHVFSPQPKVKSAVIRLVRNPGKKLNCDEDMFKKVVKAGFNQRRKTLRNSLKSLFLGKPPEHELLSQRPEQLSVKGFEELTQLLIEHRDIS